MIFAHAKIDIVLWNKQNLLRVGLSILVDDEFLALLGAYRTNLINVFNYHLNRFNMFDKQNETDIQNSWNLKKMFLVVIWVKLRIFSVSYTLAYCNTIFDFSSTFAP